MWPSCNNSSTPSGAAEVESDVNVTPTPTRDSPGGQKGGFLMPAVPTWAVEEAQRETSGYHPGPVPGVVTDNRDPEGLGRVRVRLPGYADGETSYWARVSAPMAGPEYGAYFLPDIDDEVLVAGEGGDPSLLYVLGMLWNDKRKPPDDNGDEANNVRIIRTRSGHELRFVDDDDAPEVELLTAKGQKLRFDNDGIVLDDNSGNNVSIDSNGGVVEITATSEIKLSAPTVTVKATGSATFESSGRTVVKGAQVAIN